MAGTVGAEDRVTRYGWKALAGSVIGYAMDGFDLLILGFMLAAISADLALTSTQAGSLVTWTLMGAVAGGLIFGTMSDHFGRIRVLTWTILIGSALVLFIGLGAPRTCTNSSRQVAPAGRRRRYATTAGPTSAGIGSRSLHERLQRIDGLKHC
jgi:MFS family permease